MTEPQTPEPAAAVGRAELDRNALGLQEVSERPVTRPTLGRFLWYCYHGSLPAENHSWVLHDVTCRTWILRHFGRWTMIIVPLFLAYVAFIPGPIGIRLYVGISVSLAVYLMSLVFILIDTDRRAVRAGYDHSQPSAIRNANSVERQRTTNYERRERIAARRHARAVRRGR